MSEINQTSELMFGISKQPPETCPLIDEALVIVTKAQSYTERCDKDTEEELKDRLWEIDYLLSYLMGEGILEKIRANTSNIRAWGQEWKDLAKACASDNAPRSDSSGARMGVITPKKESKDELENDDMENDSPTPVQMGLPSSKSL